MKTFIGTRMHSSRMHTACSSSCGGLSQTPPPPEQAPDPGSRQPPGPDPLPPGAGTPPAPHQDQTPPGAGTPPVDRHAPVNILPCPKLRLRAVMNILHRQTDMMKRCVMQRRSEDKSGHCTCRKRP